MSRYRSYWYTHRYTSGTIPQTEPRSREAVFLPDHILQAFLGSAALKVLVLLQLNKELEVVFQIIFRQAFSGSAALKVPGPLSTGTRSWVVFSDHMLLAGLFALQH
jgi:hypothetical protein